MNAELARLRAAVAEFFAADDASDGKRLLIVAGHLRTMIARAPKPPAWEVLDATSEGLDMEGFTLIRRRLPGGDFSWHIETPDGDVLGTLRPEDPPQKTCDGADAAREEYRRAVGERTEPEDRTGADR